MFGGNDEDLARCIQVEEEARLRRWREAELASEALALRLEREGSAPRAAPARGQLEADVALARRLAAAEEPPAPAKAASGSSIFSLSNLFPAVPRCAKCSSPLIGQHIVLRNGRKYHHECFTCCGCNQPISAAYSEKNADFYHSSCFETLFAPRCYVCNDSLSGQEFLRHVYFTAGGGYCRRHESAAKSCCSCHRKEPHDDPFVALADNRHLCFDCVSSAVFESADAKVIYSEIIEFMSSILGLQIPAGMTEVPVLAVDLGCLNDQQRMNSFECHNEGTICRGLTLSTSQTTIRFMNPGSLQWRPLATSSCSTANIRKGHWDVSQSSRMQEQHLATSTRTRSVTAVLVLFGLPRYLMASILAHEAMHVWCKLSLKMSHKDLPELVEEGLCQLVAFKYLEYVENQYRSRCKSVSGELYDTNSWEFKLIQYNKFAIEVDTTPVYGEGFRKASEAFAAIGLSELLHFVEESAIFPAI